MARLEYTPRANRIAELRAAKGITQTQLAEAIGATLSMVGKLERSERSLTEDWIRRIARVLDCLPGDLFAPIVRGWQPIDTAPKDGTWFLAYWPVHSFEDRVRVTQFSSWANDEIDRAFVDADDFIDWTSPTHWMPLPPPPVATDA